MTKDRKFSGEFIAFDEIKRELSNAKIEIRIRQDAINEDPTLRASFEQVIKAQQDKIPQLEAILATEPPPPELPPRQLLFKVSGVLEEFNVQKVIGYFTEREYDPEGFARQVASEQVGSLLLAVTGNAAGSAVTGQSKIRKDDACDFVRGKINGIPFHGWLGKTNAQPGDFVEMAVMGQGDHYVTYALMIPEIQTISMTPRCGAGREAEISFGKYAVMGIGSIFLVILTYLRIRGVDWEGIAFCAGVFAFMLAMAYFFAMRSIRKNPGPVILLSESIFSALGFSDPQWVNLPEKTKKRLKCIFRPKPTIDSDVIRSHFPV
ncbi:putative type VI secretion system effector [Salmonella enterica]|uniref:putative type VI secretion system effector n=1 Tax=Salmonella enterica TaxID=28901 RepID=UPI003D31D2C8